MPVVERIPPAIDEELGRRGIRIAVENDMDPTALGHSEPAGERREPIEVPGSRGHDVAERPEAFVLFEQGAIEQRVVHDQARVDQRRAERELEGLAQRYAAYVQASPSPVTFDQYVELMRDAHE
jgi:hypothetical protein